MESGYKPEKVLGDGKSSEWRKEVRQEKREESMEEGLVVKRKEIFAKQESDRRMKKIGKGS